MRCAGRALEGILLQIAALQAQALQDGVNCNGIPRGERIFSGYLRGRMVYCNSGKRI